MLPKAQEVLDPAQEAQRIAGDHAERQVKQPVGTEMRVPARHITHVVAAIHQHRILDLGQPVLDGRGLSPGAAQVHLQLRDGPVDRVANDIDELGLRQEFRHEIHASGGRVEYSGVTSMVLVPCGAGAKTSLYQWLVNIGSRVMRSR